MRLYIITKDKKKVYLNQTATSRSELLKKLGDEFFTISGDVYTVWDVLADKDSGSTGATSVIGGIVGLLGGPIGAVVGVALGAAIGSSQNETEKDKVEFFNRS